MTSQERVHAALKKQPADRVPVFMWFHPDTSRKLAATLGIPAVFVAEAMGNDVIQTLGNRTGFPLPSIAAERCGRSFLI